MKKIILNAHPFLFTAVSLLFIYMHVRWETLPSEIFRPLIVLWIFNLVLYFLLFKIMKNLEWAGVLLTVIALCFYFEKSVFTVVFFTTLSILLTLVLVFWLLKRQFSVFHLSFVLTLISFMFLITQSTVVLKALSAVPDSYYDSMSSRDESLAIPISTTNSDVKPDIYYIILDSYGSPNGLQEYYGYDNNDFIKYLEGLGFIVPKDIYSNYPRTALSVSSTLDMQYWDTISPKMDNVVFWWPVKPVLDHNRVLATLESIGYRSIYIASDWGLTNNTTADSFYKPYPVLLSEYENYVISTTPIKFLHAPLQNFLPVRTADVHRRFTVYGLETLKEIPDLEGPKFVFLHVIIPHQPFVFDAKGNPIESSAPFTFGKPEGISDEDYRTGYIGQIEFLNSQLQSVIESILDKSDSAPIIILQADHGLGMFVDFYSEDRGCLGDRFSIFGAYFLPGKNESVIPQDFTPVNLFRIIFNEYFDTNLDFLEGRQYFTGGHSLFAGMEEVTDQVKRTCVLPNE